MDKSPFEDEASQAQDRDEILAEVYGNKDGADAVDEERGPRRSVAARSQCDKQADRQTYRHTYA